MAAVELTKSGACRWTAAVVAAALAIGRALLSCPVNRSPPDTSVIVGGEGWEEALRRNIAEHGYSHVVGLLNRSEVEGLRSIAEGYCYGKVRKALPLSYGGYSVPGFLDVPEFNGARWLPEDPRLHTLLRAAFHGPDYRFASHNDVGCDFVGVWHKDILRGNVAQFQECDVWSRDDAGAEHEVFKVMFYLQDHEDDEEALKVIPGSHLDRRTPWERGYTALHPRMGDTVIFDQRLSHAGNTYYNPFSKGRLFMQVGFGRINRFTDEFERGTKQRQQLLQARMLNSSQPSGALATHLTDLRMATVGSLLSMLPPRLLNHFADAEVKRHEENNCANQRS